MFGQRCWSAGMAKLTLGTGAFPVVPRRAGAAAAVPPGVVASCAGRTSAATAYAFEGFVPKLRRCRQPGCAGSARCRKAGGRRSGTAPGAAATATRPPGCGACPRCSALGTPHWEPRPG